MGTAVAVDGTPEGAELPDRPPPGAARDWLPLAAITAVAAVLSFPRLGSRSLWLDEAYTVGATNQLFDTWRNTAGTQALYYLLEWPISRLSTDPAWLRILSAFLGLASVVVVARVARRLGDQREAILAAGGLALSWGLARYSVEARSYTLALLLVSLSWLALVAAIQARSEGEAQRWWRMFYVVSLLVPLAHGLATLNLVAQCAALAIAPDSHRHLLRRALRVVPAVAVEVGALFVLGAADVGDWVPPLSLGQLRIFKQLLLGFGVTGVVLSVLVAVAVVSVVRRFWRERSYESWIRVLPVFWALGPPIIVVLMSLVRPYAAARYVFPSIPGYFLLLAGLLVKLGSTRRVALAAVVIAALLVVDQPNVTKSGIEDWTGVTACIAANSQPGDRLVTAAAHRPPLDYYWPDHPELASVEALSPPEPLGQVRRLYESLTDTHKDLRSALTEDASESVWYIDRGRGGRLAIVGLVFDARIMDAYEVTDPWYFEGGLVLARLDPAGSDRPRGQAPCETVKVPSDMQPRDDR